MSTTSTFPVLTGLGNKPLPGQPKTVPLSLVQPHEAQAQRNHGQSLRRLAERGGLSPTELVAVLEDRPWRRMDPAAAVARLNELVQQFQARPVSAAHPCPECGWDGNLLDIPLCPVGHGEPSSRSTEPAPGGFPAPHGEHTMNIRAKFCCNNLAERNDTAGTKVAEEVYFAPVYSADPNSENAKWSAATPGGQLHMYISNPDAWGAFEQGKEYFLDFTPAG